MVQWLSVRTSDLKVPGSILTEDIFIKTGDSKNIPYTVNNTLTKIIGKNSGLFARYFSTAVLQQCFRKAYFGQKKWVFVQYF